MIKTTLFMVATLTAAAALADDKVYGLHCRAQKPHGFESVEIKAELILGDWIKNVTVTAVDYDYANQLRTQVGRAAQWESDRTYKPRKYKDHVRYNTTQLTDTADFSKYYPGDMCEIQVMVPENYPRPGKFKAPMLFHCDQSGGKAELDCETLPRE